MIIETTPYCLKSEGKNLGKAYNRLMELLPNDEDYMIFRDHDTIWSTYDWFPRIEQALEEKPYIKCATVLTNRVMCRSQLANVDRKNNDVQYHREIGTLMAKAKRHQIQDITDMGFISGVVIIIQKALWKRIGGFNEDNMLNVDNDMHRKIKALEEKIYLLKDQYVYHWYSNCDLTKQRDISHLQ